jgi:hypothetical protein
VTINQTKHQDSITPDQITLRFDAIEPVVIPRADVRTRLQLIDWVYRLTGHPGMTMEALRAFITAVFQRHGWRLSDAEQGSGGKSPSVIDSAPELAAAA